MRLIDAEPIEIRYNTEALGRREMYEMVKNAPTIDAVQIIRCKDCRWRDADEKHHCIDINRVFDQMDFCSFAERKDDDKIEGNYE